MNFVLPSPTKQTPVVPTLKKEKCPRLPRTLACDCGKEVKVSRYITKAGYKCAGCRPQPQKQKPSS